MFARYIYPGHRNNFIYPGAERGRLRHNARRLAAPALRCATLFCRHTSAHGLSHVAAAGRHWAERVLWLFIVAFAAWFAVDVSLGQYQRYNESPTVVTIEKDFRSWNTSMPGVTACQKNRVDATKLPLAIKKYWNKTEKDQKYSYYASFVSTVAHSDLQHLSIFQEYERDASLNVDLFQLVVDVLPPPQFKGTWSIGYLSKWTPIMTEFGACYSTNSIVVADVAIEKPMDNDTTIYPITCKYSKLSCYVIFEVDEDTDFIYHSPYDIADITLPKIPIILSLYKQTELSIMETRAGQGIKDLQPRRRHCLYHDEPMVKGYTVYSSNNCRQSCRNRLALQLCGCKPFYYTHAEGPPCTVAGMACLATYADRLVKIEGISCPCIQQCVDAIFKELFHEDQSWRSGPFANRGGLRLTVQSPQTRYTREIVFHFHDLVVSFGGAAGLFLGASFISFVEILYFIIVRTCGFIGLRKKENLPKFQKPKPWKQHEAVRRFELQGHFE